MDIRALIRDIPDFPQPGILFRDITTLLRDPQGLRYTLDALHQSCSVAGMTPDYVVGMESRGFLFGPSLAYQMNAGFVPVRKPGKLPAQTHSAEYELEYGSDRLEIHQDAIPSGAKVLIVDDLIATGGTAQAAAELVAQSGGNLIGYAFIIELLALKGRDKLGDVPIVSLLQY
ncbi:MAG: adenine phosphoribosyltransferase [Spirulinaceae cyanobacterium]